MRPRRTSLLYDGSRSDKADNAYPFSLENMIARFEEPSSMVRWDSPLFTITWTDEKLPMDRIWDAVTHGNVKPPNAGTQAVGGVPV